ncbi:MAG TPA: tetratricopeptide repeat protein [Phycisphaerae bacterium]|nr:tetratricopeptide repeat protein [Phycisphaerae bacterium]
MPTNDPQTPTMNMHEALNLAIGHHQAGRLAEAEAIYLQILRLEPKQPDALHLLGMIELQTGRGQRAVDLIKQAIDIDPSAAVYYNNLGLALQDRGDLDAAVAAYRRAIELLPDYATAYSNLGNAFGARCQFDEAIEAYGAALRVKPDFAEAKYNLGNAFKDTGRIDEAIAVYRDALKIKTDYITAQSNLIFALYFSPKFNAQEIHQELLNWTHRHAEPLKKFILPHTNHRDPERRLKIGYISGDFREHVVGWNLSPLLRQHNREQLEIFCYSSSKSFDNLTRSIKESADVWRNIAGIDDQRAAQIIRDDQIDILIDLASHTANNRLLIFARKPAPVQVTYLGYAGSTGLDTIDYRFSDPYLDPPESDLSIYSEQTMRLPEVYWCYQPGGSAPQVTPLPALSAGFITFGCMNNFYKVSSGAWDLWMQILGAVPNSRLIIYAHVGSHRDVVRERFGKNGIAPERLEFIGKQPWPEYMNTYNRIDIALDPFPYNGGITTCDSL